MPIRRVSAKERAIAFRMAQELDIVARKGATVSRRITAYLRREAIAAIRERRPLDPRVTSNKMVVDLTALLEKAMQVAMLLGIRRVALLTNQQSLQLDLLDDQLKTLRQLLIDYYADKLPLVNLDINNRIMITAVKLVQDAARETQVKLRETVNRVITERTSVRNGITQLQDTFQTLGLSGSEWRLETIFRTQTQLAYNGAKYRAAQTPAVDDILWGYKYVTVGDDRVRPEHEALDGVVLPKDDPFWNQFWPPNGWNCRCAVIPLYESRAVVQPPINAEIDPNFAYNPGLL